jgi:hypothetical protein
MRLALRCREAIAPNRAYERALRQCEAQGLPWVTRPLRRAKRTSLALFFCGKTTDWRLLLR